MKLGKSEATVDAVEKKSKPNWIYRLRYGKSSFYDKLKKTKHCNDFSSVACSRCCKCWSNDYIDSTDK